MEGRTRNLTQVHVPVSLWEITGPQNGCPLKGKTYDVQNLVCSYLDGQRVERGMEAERWVPSDYVSLYLDNCLPAIGSSRGHLALNAHFIRYV